MNEVGDVQSQEEHQEPNDQRQELKVEVAAALDFADCLFWLLERHRD